MADVFVMKMPGFGHTFYRVDTGMDENAEFSISVPLHFGGDFCGLDLMLGKLVHRWLEKQDNKQKNTGKPHITGF